MDASSGRDDENKYRKAPGAQQRVMMKSKPALGQVGLVTLAEHHCYKHIGRW